MFKGDKPAAQFEAGQQKGGNYYCFACGIHAEAACSYIHSNKLTLQTLSERIDIINMSQNAQSKSKTGNLKLFDHLKKHEIVEELNIRNVKFLVQDSSKDLQDLLDATVHGIQHVPAILFNNFDTSLSDIKLQNYEILFTEPLHDVSNHIKNMYAEIPYQIDKQKRKEVLNVIEFSFNNKDACNSADYRKSLLVVANWFRENMSDSHITEIMVTLREIQGILYLPDCDRTPLTVLRLYLTVFLHALFIKITLRGNSKKT